MKTFLHYIRYHPYHRSTSGPNGTDYGTGATNFMEASMLKSAKTMIFLSGFLATVFSMNAMAEDTKASLKALKQELNKYGSPKIEGTDSAGDKTVPGIFFGTKKINNNYDVVDNVKKSHGGTATVFVKDGEEFVRVTTNVLKADGTRAIGTTLAHNKAYDAVNKGETFCGIVEILGAPYDTCYEPIKEGANTIGIYYVGYKK